jgi:uncharacterized membrane protein YebE (DUF533 family)
MSLMKTLAKVAIGVAVAKGANSMMKRSSGGTSNAGGGLGGLLGGLTGGTANAGGAQRHGGAHSPGGGLEGMLGGLLGGGAGSAMGGGGAAGGGLGGLLEQLGGTGAAGAAGAGGLGGLLGGLAGAVQSGGGGGLLDGTDEPLQRRPERENAGFGSVLNSQFDSNPEPEIEPSQDQEAAAGLMLAAMIQAAKSDGNFDEGERDKLLAKLGDVDAQEAAFVKQQMARPVDIDGLVAQTPKGMEQQIYAMSLLGIDLDTQDEAQYLHKLAQGFGMQPAAVNNIHEQMGVPSLYT